MPIDYSPSTWPEHWKLALTSSVHKQVKAAVTQVRPLFTLYTKNKLSIQCELGDIPFTVLIPACVDACKSAKSPLTGGPVHVIAAGGIYDGRGLAAALMYGAQAVWVGSRFVASVESGAPKRHKEAYVFCCRTAHWY